MSEQLTKDELDLILESLLDMKLKVTNADYYTYELMERAHKRVEDTIAKIRTLRTASEE
ncbi:MAG TPA: hypothetical protein VF707_06405 [Ardenticatenaceae bacterium]|jgi:hypothetical protein